MQSSEPFSCRCHHKSSWRPSWTTTQGERQHADLPSLKLKLEIFAASALDHGAGTNVGISDALQSRSIDDLIDRVTRSHESTQSARNGIAHSYQNDFGNEHRNPVRYGSPEGNLFEEVRGILRGPLDEIQGIAPCSPMQENLVGCR